MNPVTAADLRSGRTSRRAALGGVAQRSAAARRRGATLLFVVTMLVLFTLAGTTFLVIATQFRKSARTASRVGRHFDPPVQLADDALGILLRGSTNVNAIGPHSLLADKYDALRGFKARVVRTDEFAALGNPVEASGTPQPIGNTGGQFITLRLSNRMTDPLLDLPGNGIMLPADQAYAVALGQQWDQIAATPFRISTRIDFYAGCEVTFLNGPAAGVTLRVIRSDIETIPPGVQVPRLVAMIERGEATRSLFPPVINSAAFLGNDILINGRAYDGLGAAVQLTGGQAGTTSNQILEPNRSADGLAVLVQQYLAGGTNEGHDAADLQNLFLGAVVTDGPNGGGNVRVIPSFHRPALINFAMLNLGTGPHPNRVLLMPFSKTPAGRVSGDNSYPWLDQIDTAEGGGTLTPVVVSTAGPNFPTLADPVNGPWHVDNDGDLIPDSVWLDLGYPIRTAPDGSRFKPLVAMHVVDLDGRLNVNAHGSVWHGDLAYQQALIPRVVTNRTNTPVNTQTLMARGQGYGPPEISLRPLFTNAAHQLLLAARYGGDGVPGRLQTVPTQLEPWADLRFFDMPLQYQTSLTSYSSPPDLQGRFTYATDLSGNPFYEFANPGVRPNELQESPYEIDLSRDGGTGPTLPNPADRPFGPEELEMLLRPYDLDTPSLPSRLGQIARVMDPTFRLPPEQLLTTESWDLPVPGFVVPEANFRMPNGATIAANYIAAFDSTARFGSIVEYFEARVGTPLTPVQLTTLFAPEVILGQRMDLNRPFGDGRDNPTPGFGTGNGIVDEHAAVANVSESAVVETIATPMGFVPIDHNNNGAFVADGDTTEHQARQIFGTHLYTLMMTLLPPSNPGNPQSVIALDYDLDGTPTEEETAFIVAQWVANVIDFRDADSINTYFEFDPTPFTTLTAVDGVYPPNDGVDTRYVWGMERPDLLITEAIGWHDRRATDEAAGMSGMGDDDLDSQLKPVGSAFIELYNPWSNLTRSPAELSFYNGTVTPGIDLRTAWPGASPAWRIAVIKGENGTFTGSTSVNSDPDFPNTLSTAASSPLAAPDPADYDRIVYFVSQDQGLTYPAGPTGSNPKIYYPTSDVRQALTAIPPLGYGVVGSAGSRYPDGGNRYVSLIGTRTDATLPATTYGDLNPDDTRRIVLVAGQAVEIQDNTVGGSIVRNNVVAIPIGDFNNGATQPENRSFNVSEPRDGYTGQAFAPRFPGDFSTDETTEFTLATAIDEVLDDGNVGGFTSDQRLAAEGTHQNFCFVHLQRLANPLLPYDEFANPYLTIDSTPLDVTVFNGTAPGDNPPGTAQQFEFATLERGRGEWDLLGATRAAPPTVDLNGLQLWRNEMRPASGVGGRTYDVTTDDGDPNYIFQHPIVESLGTLNNAYAGRVPDPTVGVVGFPWLAFHNRPFVSQLELLNVPFVRNSRLGRAFTVGSTPLGTPYAPTDPTIAASPVFGHLLNWYASGQNRANFHRLLEMVHVPTRFIGHETYLNPTFFNHGTNADFYRQLRNPPFNRVASYREPGKLNLNTIYDPRVWAGLQGYLTNAQTGFADVDHTPAEFDDFVTSRRGYPPATGGVWDINNNFPDMIMNPFRAPGTADLAPTAYRPPVFADSTVMRSTEGGASPVTPLFERSPASAATIQPYEDPRRSAVFRTDSFQRLGNLTTTRSNVFAVWITVGYFEVTANGLPDRELGSDTGTTKRHRSFYVIDRSIPVAFEPGADHNVDDAVLVRRRIE